MRLFLLARGFTPSLLTLTLVSAATGVLCRLLVPVLMVPGILIPVPLLLPLLSVIALGPVLHSPFATVEALSPRRITSGHSVMLLGLIAWACLTTAVTLTLFGHPELAPLAIRNTLGLMALALIAAGLLGHEWAWLFPSILVAAAAIDGIDRFSRPYIWAWVLSGSTTDSSGLVVLFLSGIALAIVLLRLGRGRRLLTA